MKFGLEVQVIENIISVLEQYQKVDKAFVFGSRAKGNYRPDSDIDIAIKGNEITTDDIITISVAIETKGITHKFDLIDYNSIKEPALKEHIDRVGIEFYSRWKEVKLGNLTKLITKGTTPSSLGGKFIDKGINYIKSEAVSYDGKIDKSTFVFIDEEMHKKLRRSQLAKDDILYSMAGIFLGKNGLVTEEMLPANTNQALAIIRLDQNKALPKFIHYYLRQKSVIDFVNNMSGQSAQPNINFEEIKAIGILLPPLPEQNAISSILSSLDDKIDLLHRQNKTFEQLAETLFRQLFVEEAEDNWESEKLKKYVTTVDNRGKTPPVYDIQTEFPLIEANAINGDERLINYSVIKKYVTKDTFANWFRNKLSKYDTIITTVGANIGAMAMFVIEKGNIAQNLIGLSANGISPFYLYQMLRFKKDEILQMDIGGVQPSLKVPHLLSIEIPIPPIELQNKFDSQVFEFVSKMEINYNQIRTLTQTRDTLLPKLMSGEVRVEM